MQIINEEITLQFTQLNLGDITQLIPIEHGISQQCFYVQIQNKLTLNFHNYVVKVYQHCKDITSLREYKAYCAFNNTWPNSAKLIAYTDNLLVLEKINGDTLTDYRLKGAPLNDLLTLSVNAMFDLHQLPKPDFNFCLPVSFEKVFEGLFTSFEAQHNNAQRLSHQVYLPHPILARSKQNIQILIEQINTLNKNNDLVICHGDLNFGNMITDQLALIHDTELLVDNILCKIIDFESLCLMPPEYDIAMALAINELPESLIAQMCSLYQFKRNSTGSHCSQVIKHCVLNETLIGYYYQLALYINGMWYLQQNIEQDKLNQLDKNNNIDLACRQFKLLADKYLVNNITH